MCETHKLQGTKGNRTWTSRFYIVLFLFTFCLLPCALCSAAFAAWQSIDESVVGKYAREHGRQAHEPLINTDQGDLLLFVFLVGGAVGGFAAGYYWRVLMEGKGRER